MEGGATRPVGYFIGDVAEIIKMDGEIRFETTDRINSPNNAQFRDRYELCKSTCLHCTCTCAGTIGIIL